MSSEPKPRPASRPLRALALQPRVPGTSPATVTRRTAAAGITIQHIAVAPAAAYNYAWMGSSHYLALHELRLQDGEIFNDDQKVGRSLDLRGKLTFAPAGCGVWGWSRPTEGLNSFTAVYFDPSEMEPEVVDRFAAARSPHVYFSEPGLRATLGKLQAALTSPLGADNLYVDSLSLLAASEMSHYLGADARRGATPAGYLTLAQEHRVHDYVEAHLAADIGLTELAAAVGLSQYHFIRAYKKSTGNTPYQHLLRRRIELAQALVRQSQFPIAEIAPLVGFKSVTQFIRQFRALVGTTPAAFRSRTD